MANQLAHQLFGGDDFKKAQSNNQSEFPKQGIYAYMINKVSLKETRKNGAGMFIDLSVVHVWDDDEGDGHRVGDAVTHLLMAKFDQFLGNVKGFIAGVLGMSPTDIGEDEVMQILAEGQPLAGMIVQVRNKNIITQKGKTFTTVTYKREVSGKELKEVITPLGLETFFPGNALEDRIAQEAEDAAD